MVRGVSVLKTVEPAIAGLRGRQVVGVRRRAKLLLLEFTGNLVLVIHLRRNGRLRSVPRGTGRTSRDLALVLAFDRGPDVQMIELGPKKAASVWVFPAGGLDAPASPFAGHGIEPFSAAWTSEALAQALRGARMRLKAFLVTQRYVVGIGNTYADEILWEARLSPQAMTSTLDPGFAGRLGGDDVARLHRAVISELQADRPGLTTSFRVGARPVRPSMLSSAT
jgi:formamidopyrimidine-DNA glycosylase